MMISLYEVDPVLLGGNVRLMSEEMRARGWTVETPYAGSYNLFIDRGDGRIIHIYSLVPPATSYASGVLSDDKYAVSQYLRSLGINQLADLMKSELENETFAFFVENQPVVVKPLDGAHGEGVTVGIINEQQLRNAFDIAKSKSASGRVLVQKQFTTEELKDIRVTIMNGKFMGALLRTPAYVVGDGHSTVLQLIQHENTTFRGTAYVDKVAKIDISKAKAFLGSELILKILPKDEKMSVLGIGNYGAGGELTNVSDLVPEWMKDESVFVAESIGVVNAGIDYLVAGKLSPQLSNSIENVVLIEVNKNPAVFMHDIASGKNDTIKAYVDYIESL